MSARYIEIQLCSEDAKMPYKKYFGDAGWDLFVSRDCVIPPKTTVDVHTDVRMDMPPYLFARIVGRSSTLRKHGLLVNEGIIDNGYVGELFVGVHNVMDKEFHVKKGMRLAQIIFHHIEDARWSQVDEIRPTSGKRGDAGFGSTGE